MNTMPKYVHLNNWIFEVKAVRALRVDNYGEPYSAIANINVNGDVAYLDGLMKMKRFHVMIFKPLNSFANS